MPAKPSSNLRLFFALWPTDAECSALSSWQPLLRQLCGGRATPAEALHATLVFIGNVDSRRMDALHLAAQEVRGKEFEMAVDSARYWGHNHIVYAAPGVMPPQLEQLVCSLGHRLTAHHFAFDTRPFKPHITLLRHACCSDSPFPDIPAVTWRARDFALIQSQFDGSGVHYRILERFPLH